MPLPPDYHTHTPLCRHATGEPSELAAQALRVGLAEMGFSDHNPMPKDDFDDWRMRAADLDLYVAKVEKARRDHPRLIIKLALEVDFLPGYEDWVRDLAARHPWDYLIGSVHYLSPDWAIDNPTQLSEWKRRNALEVWTAYCEHLTKAAESGLFDIIGHADLCKKFAFYPQQESAPLFKAFIQAAKRHRVAIELNTAGLRKECREIYPSLAILQLAATERVPITFGSDAHAPEEVGLNLTEAVQLARSAGYTHSLHFTRRRGQEVAL
ncbi:MAG TPA: histidinol-phosphatase HisJ family protein [Candidatus Limnocylindrales bacterium]|jgi:histidinol-phosphatase (PHP family)|nr:histidinol-phosphatase HisJ family protein [Candidatus Limnocylindrales bacterium]